MCDNCQTNLFCSCFQAHLKKEKIQRRDRAVKALTTVLQKRRITYSNTHVDNVVAIPLADASRVLLSLKSRRDEQYYVVYKYRPANSSQWLELRRDAFFSWLIPLTVATSQSTGSAELMPFGKYKGRLVSDIAATDKRYCQWVLEEVAGHQQLKDAISALM